MDGFPSRPKESVAMFYSFKDILYGIDLSDHIWRPEVLQMLYNYVFQ